MKSIDDDALDLLSQFLVYNPGSRLAATDALHHKYFHDCPAATLSAPVSEDSPVKERTSIGHSKFAKPVQLPLFSAHNIGEINFDISSFGRTAGASFEIIIFDIILNMF